MFKKLFCYSQYVLPQHWLSRLAGKLANSKNTAVKNWIIDSFCRKYNINLSEALIEDPHAYVSFNDFFTRTLKEGVRPIDPNPHSIVSPADGVIAERGSIHHQRLIQAKDMYFNLSTLLGGQTELAERFEEGQFATIYLAPHNYHRVHMPLTGKLRQTVYIPGKLFSVNRMTSQLIPNLYARNERLVLVFETEFGPMAVILVGALIVGSMQTVWMDQPIRHPDIQISSPQQEILLEKGAELGQFQLGSTVVLLLPPTLQLEWAPAKNPQNSIMTGQTLGSLSII